MVRLNILEIREFLSFDGWKLISEEYKNLEEILHFQCLEGHDVYAPYKAIRKERKCPVCAENSHKNPSTSIVKKGETPRILALDQSTHVTAWSVFDGPELIKYGIFEATRGDDTERIHAIRNWFLSLIENWEPDMVGIEDIQLQNFGGGALKDSDNVVGIQTYKILAKLQGVLADAAFGMGIPVKVCSTQTWRSYCQVRGRTRADKKSSIRALVKSWYDITVGDDEADAIGIGRYTAATYNLRMTDTGANIKDIPIRTFE